MQDRMQSQNLMRRDFWWAYMCVMCFWAGFVAGHEMDWGLVAGIHICLALVLVAEWARR